MLLNILVPLVLFGLVIWGVVALVGRSNRAGRVAGASAKEILEQRYARGEISTEEFRTIRQELTRP